MENKIYDVFLSYRRRHGGWEVAKLINEGLRNEGISVFSDWEEMCGCVNFSDQLSNAIKQCKYVVIILTGDTLDGCINNENDWFKFEIETAIKNKKKICPVFTSDYKCPKNLPKSISTIGSMHGLLINEWNWYEVIQHIATGVDKLKEQEIKNKIGLDKPNSLYSLIVQNGIYYIIDFEDIKNLNDNKINQLSKYKKAIIQNFKVSDKDIKIVSISLKNKTIKDIELPKEK